jgi:hypothetical protein
VPPAAVVAPAPALPEEPLDLIPSGASEVGRVSLERLRSSLLFGSIEGSSLRLSCAPGERSHFLAHRTERLAFATYMAGPDESSEQGVVVLRGRYTEDDAASALRASAWLAGGHRGPKTQREQGRFVVHGDGVAAAVLLSPELLVFGHDAQVKRVLELASGKGESWVRDPPFLPGLDARAVMPRQTLAMVARLNERRARRIGRSLAEVGGGGLVNGLDRSTAALSVLLERELRAELRVQYPDAQLAAATASELRSTISRAGFVLRLLGLRALVERLDIQAEGSGLRLTLDVSEQDARDLLDRLMPLLEGEAPSCPAAPAGQMTRRKHTTPWVAS